MWKEYNVVHNEEISEPENSTVHVFVAEKLIVAHYSCAQNVPTLKNSNACFVSNPNLEQNWGYENS